MTPLASVAMLEKFALLKIALCNAPASSSASFARLRAVTSSMARTSNSPCWPAWSLRALSSITRRPITGKLCSSSKSLKTELVYTFPVTLSHSYNRRE